MQAWEEECSIYVEKQISFTKEKDECPSCTVAYDGFDSSSARLIGLRFRPSMKAVAPATKPGVQ